MYQRAMIRVVPPRLLCQQRYHRWARRVKTRTIRVIKIHRTVKVLARGKLSYKHARAFAAARHMSTEKNVHEKN